jgi:hypothetical protein
MRSVSPVGPCRDDEHGDIFAIVNEARKRTAKRFRRIGGVNRTCP